MSLFDVSVLHMASFFTFERLTLNRMTSQSFVITVTDRAWVNIVACEWLGVLFTCGDDCEKNESLAFAWLRGVWDDGQGVFTVKCNQRRRREKGDWVREHDCTVRSPDSIDLRFIIFYIGSSKFSFLYLGGKKGSNASVSCEGSRYHSQAVRAFL